MSPQDSTSSADSAGTDAPAVAGPEVALRQRERTRRVVVFTSLLTLVVIGGVIGLGLKARDDDARRRQDRAYLLQDIYRDPSRRVSWPAEGCEPDRERPPHLVFDLPPEGLDFGAVKQGVRLEAEVVFRNDGVGPLCVRDVDVDCGCVKAELVGDRARFEPGESGSVKVVLDTEGREGRPRKTVTLHTNAVEPRSTFEVQASITRGLIVHPMTLSFPRATRGRPLEARVRLRSAADDVAWEVLGVDGLVKDAEGRTTTYAWSTEALPDPAQRMVDLVITHPGLAEEGRIQDTLRIRTSYPDRPEIRVVVYGMVVPPVLVQPDTAVLGRVPSASVARLRIVSGNPGAPLELGDSRWEADGGAPAPSAGAGFVASVRKGPTDDAWTVEVRYDGRARSPGPIRAVLVVETSNPDQPELRIPCHATVVESG